MLFDLRSRNRRAAVRVIYILLAVVMAGGLILVGVGTGTGGGGLLNAFSGNNSNSSSSSGNSAAAKQAQTALVATQQHPQSPSAWVNLMQARLEQAQSSSAYYTESSDETSGTFTAAGQSILGEGITAWQRYLTLTKNRPSLTATSLAKVMYAGMNDYAGLTTTYQYLIKLEPNAASPYTCLTYAAYADANKSIGDLAASQAVSLTPKADRVELKSTFTAARKKVATAKAYYTAEC